MRSPRASAITCVRCAMTRSAPPRATSARPCSIATCRSRRAAEPLLLARVADARIVKRAVNLDGALLVERLRLERERAGDPGQIELRDLERAGLGDVERPRRAHVEQHAELPGLRVARDHVLPGLHRDVGVLAVLAGTEIDRATVCAAIDREQHEPRILHHRFVARGGGVNFLHDVASQLDEMIARYRIETARPLNAKRIDVPPP